MKNMIDTNFATALFNIKFEIEELKTAHLNSRWQSGMTLSPYTRIYMIKDGYGIIWTENEKIELLPGKIYVIPYGTRFAYRCDDFMDKIYIHFRALLPDKSDVFDSAGCIFQFDDTENLTAAIENCIPPETAAKILGINAITQKIAFKCALLLGDRKIRAYSDYTKSIIDYVEENLNVNLTAEKIAEGLFTSSAKLRKIFRAETGMSLGKYIDIRIMTHAELMVRSGQKTLKEISDMLGFCDQFYFSRCFAKKYGLPPLTYRKQKNMF